MEFDYKRMMVLLVLALLAVSVYDGWLVYSGQVNFNRHWPGFLPMTLVLCMYIVHRIEKSRINGTAVWDHIVRILNDRDGA